MQTVPSEVLLYKRLQQAFADKQKEQPGFLLSFEDWLAALDAEIEKGAP